MGFSNMPKTIRNRIIINTLSHTIGQGMLYLLGMLTFVLTMRYLGPEGFGKYSLVLVYVGIMGSLVEFGGQIVLIREICQRPEQTKKILGNFIILKAALATLVCSLGAVAIHWLGYSKDVQFYVLLGLMAILFSVPSAVAVLFQARLQMWYVSGVNVVGKLIAVAAVGYMLWSRGGIAVLMWGNVIAAAVASGLFCWLIWNRERPDFQLDINLIKNLVRKTAPIGLLLILGGLVFKADTLLLSKLADDRAVGLYNAAYKFVDWGIMLAGGLLISHFPLFSQFIISDPEKVKRLYQRSFDIFGLLLIPLAVFGAVASRQIILLFSGPAYEESAFALAVLLWVILLNAWNTLAVNVLIALKEQRRLLIIYGSVVAVNVSINYFGIPRFGFKVCAIASVLSELLAMVPLLHFLKKGTGIMPNLKKAGRSLLATLCAASPLLLQPNLILVWKAAIFMPLWLIFSFGFKCISFTEIRDLFYCKKG